MLKRGGKVYSQVIKDAKEKTLLPIIRRKIQADSVVYIDGFRAYNAPAVSEFKHHRINPDQKFVDDNSHINGIENFWHPAKRHLQKFSGSAKNKFPLFLKAGEFRFNDGDAKSPLHTRKKWRKNYHEKS